MARLGKNPWIYAHRPPPPRQHHACQHCFQVRVRSRRAGCTMCGTLPYGAEQERLHTCRACYILARPRPAISPKPVGAAPELCCCCPNPMSEHCMLCASLPPEAHRCIAPYDARSS